MAHELGDIVIGRPFDDIPTGAALHDPAALQDRHLVTELQGLIQIVADEQNRFFDTSAALMARVDSTRAIRAPLDP